MREINVNLQNKELIFHLHILISHVKDTRVQITETRDFISTVFFVSCSLRSSLAIHQHLNPFFLLRSSQS